MAGHTFLFSPPVVALKALIQSGSLGKIQYIYSQRLNLGQVRTDCDALWSLAPHDISVMSYLLAEDPIRVSATGHHLLSAQQRDVYFGTLWFPSGVVGNIHVSWLDPRKVRLITVVGAERMVVYDDVSADHKISIFDSAVVGSSRMELAQYKSMAEFQWTTRAGDILIPKIDMVEPLAEELKAFAAACGGGVLERGTAVQGKNVVAVLEALSSSAQACGEAVRV
jgi:predicted dehydrogenase